jgi:hypothetical protein
MVDGMAKKHGSSIKDDERFGLVPDNDQTNPESSSTSPGDDATTDVDDQFRAILEGLRTTLPGVQVLFALTLPLQTAFDDPHRLVLVLHPFGHFPTNLTGIASSRHRRVWPTPRPG